MDTLASVLGKDVMQMLDDWFPPRDPDDDDEEDDEDQDDQDESDEDRDY